MDLQHVLAYGGGAAVSDQQSLALQASRVMLQCQQLQWECLQAKCGLSPAVSEWLVDSCSALPVNEQLHLLNEQIEVLRQRLQNHAEVPQTRVIPVTAANATPSNATAVYTD